MMKLKVIKVFSIWEEKTEIKKVFTATPSEAQCLKAIKQMIEDMVFKQIVFCVDGKVNRLNPLSTRV